MLDGEIKFTNFKRTWIDELDFSRARRLCRRDGASRPKRSDRACNGPRRILERVSDRYFLRECAGKPADRVFARTKFNAEPAGIFYRRRAGRLYDIFYVQLRYAAIIAGARICYRCAKRGLKRMRLYAFLLRWAARGQSACRLAVEHVSFKI